MFDLNIPIAFGAGLVSFFAPCVVPLLPAYIGYVTGVSVKDLKEKGYEKFRKQMLVSSLFYILGFSVVFVILGSAIASLGGVLRTYDHIIQRVGGLIILILGLEFAGFLNFPFLAKTRQFVLPQWVNKLGPLRAFVIGLIFATAWTPCVGAILGSILSLAAVSGTAFRGATLLFVYSLGISLPFLIVSMTLIAAPKYLSIINKHVGKISLVAGIILAILGLLLLTDTYKYLNSWLFEVAFRFGYEIR
jgi:cytochrome c-type biogenesis protein